MNNNKFHEEVTKPMFAVAFGICIFCVLVDYSFQLIDAIDVIINAG